jgi:hypothetical protein
MGMKKKEENVRVENNCGARKYEENDKKYYM